jgi:hypothetical protein
MSLKSVLSKSTPEEGHVHTSFFLLYHQLLFTWRPKYDYFYRDIDLPNALMCNTHYICGADSVMCLNNTQNAFLFCHCNNGYANAPEYYVIRTYPMLLICSAPCGSGLQDQESEPVQIHCKQLHWHTSYVCKLATVCGILQHTFMITIWFSLCGSQNWVLVLLSLNPHADIFSGVWE